MEGNKDAQFKPPLLGQDIINDYVSLATIRSREIYILKRER